MASEAFKRRLTAVLRADVKGYGHPLSEELRGRVGAI